MIIATIPAHNEESHIGNIIRKASKYVEEVIVVDDGSTDNTSYIARLAGATVISHERNEGAGYATKTCLEAAAEREASILVTLDGDGQHNADEIPKLILPIREGAADLVIGSRFLDIRSNISKHREFGIKIITFLYNFASNVKVSDAQSGYRAYSRKAIGMLNITERGFGFSVELLIQARRKGLVITEVPISCIYFPDSHSLHPIIHGIIVALSVVKLRLIKPKT